MENKKSIWKLSDSDKLLWNSLPISPFTEKIAKLNRKFDQFDANIKIAEKIKKFDKIIKKDGK